MSPTEADREPRSAAAQRRCPACGEPVYGWAKLGGARGDDDGYVVDRCERCGLGLTRPLGAEPAPPGNGRPAVALADLPSSPDPDATLERARAELARSGPVELRAPNRDSLQAGIGGDQWAAFEPPPSRLYLTPRAIALMLPRHGLRATRVRHPVAGRSLGWMWQTLLNAFTFHTNFARDVIAGRLVPGNARSLVTFSVDAVVSTVAALPILILAVPLEVAAALARRGGELAVTIEADPHYHRSGGR